MIKRAKARRTKRKGATVLEISISLFLFLVLTLGMLDFGIGVFRYHILSNAARHAARRASVHGDMAPAGFGSWGPGTISNPATANGIPIIDGPDGVQPLLVGCDLNATQITVEWPDGDNEVESLVRVTVTSPYTPLFGFIFPNGTVNLTAVSTMQISH
jgi:hypothetical protein